MDVLRLESRVAAAEDLITKKEILRSQAEKKLVIQILGLFSELILLIKKKL